MNPHPPRTAAHDWHEVREAMRSIVEAIAAHLKRIADAIARGLCRAGLHTWGPPQQLASISSGLWATGTRHGAVTVPAHDLTMRACHWCGTPRIDAVRRPTGTL